MLFLGNRFSLCARFFVLLLAPVLTGCSIFQSPAENVSIYRQHSGSEKGGGTIIALDAKQRVIMEKDVDDGDFQARMFCAEPSPDALSATSSAFATSGALKSGAQGGGQTALGLAQTIIESAGSIGLRTQTIQLLRDAMFRLCEAYWNRAFDKEATIRMHRRFQVTMTGLLAIEQLTGVVQASPIILRGGEVSVGASAFVSNDKATKTATPTNTPGTPTNTPGTPTNTPATPTNTPATPTNTLGTPTNMLADALAKNVINVKSEEGKEAFIKLASPRLDEKSVELVSKTVASIVDKTLDSLLATDICLYKLDFVNMLYRDRLKKLRSKTKYLKSMMEKALNSNESKMSSGDESEKKIKAASKKKIEKLREEITKEIEEVYSMKEDSFMTGLLESMGDTNKLLKQCQELMGTNTLTDATRTDEERTDEERTDEERTDEERTDEERTDRKWGG